MNTFSKASLTLLLAGGLVGSALGNTIELDVVPGYQSGGGGEFTAVLGPSSVLSHAAYAADTVVTFTDSSDLGTIKTGFETFCLAPLVSFHPETYYNYAVSSTILPGGAAITEGTAWLYYEFATDGLASPSATITTTYNYAPGVGRQSTAGLLQQAIWDFQANTYNSSNGFEKDAVNYLGTAAAAKGAVYGQLASDVLSLNLSVVPSGPAVQPQLYLKGRLYVPDAGMAALLFGMGLLAIAGVQFSRRREMAR